MGDPAPAGGLKQQILRGGTFLIGREFLSIILSLTGMLVITRVIGPSDYGSYAAALGVYQYAITICQGGIGVYLVRASSDASDRSFFVASNLLLLFALLLFAMMQAGKGLLSSWINIAGFQELLGALLLALPFQAVATVATAKLERALDFRRIAMVEISGQLIYYSVAVPMALTGFGVWSLVYGWCLQQIIICIVLHVAAGYVPRPAWSRNTVVDILRYSLGFSSAAWAWQMRSLVNPFIVGPFLGAQAVGYVSLCIRVVEMLTVAKAIIWRLSVAAFSKIQDEPVRLLNAINRGMELQILAVAPPLLAFAWFGDWIVPLVLGEQWAPITSLFPFIALSYLINTQFNMHASALYVLRRNFDVLSYSIANLLMFALVSWLAVPKLGIVGYGWGEVVAFASYILLHFPIARRLGSPNYGLVTIWCIAVAVGLFWKSLGVWAIAVPFAALLWPSSISRLLWLWKSLRLREDPMISSTEAKP